MGPWLRTNFGKLLEIDWWIKHFILIKNIDKVCQDFTDVLLWTMVLVAVWQLNTKSNSLWPLILCPLALTVPLCECFHSSMCVFHFPPLYSHVHFDTSLACAEMNTCFLFAGGHSQRHSIDVLALHMSVFELAVYIHKHVWMHFP